MARSRQNWKKVRLEEVCEDITVGHVGPMADEYVEEGIPFLRSQNIEPFRINTDGIKFISEAFHQRLKKCALGPGDVAVVRTGYPGTAAVIPSWLPVANCADLVVIRPSRAVSPVFLVAVLNSAWGRSHIAGQLVGVAQQHFNIGTARRLELPLPPVELQHRVAGILSAYDDLIENNTKRIKILEEMARSLYREWFVNFQFPGHNRAKFVKSALGQIPEGWRVARLGEIATKIGSGATPKGGEAAYRDTGITLIRSMNVYDAGFSDDGLAFLDDEQAEGLANVAVESRDILLNITGASVARCCMVPDRLLPARVNQHVMIIRADPDLCDPHFLLASINSEQRKKLLLSCAEGGGATRQALTKETVSNFQIVLPTRTLVARFSSSARDIALQREVLAKQNQVLRATRDLLLPRLISGEIDVSSLPPEPAAS